MTRFERELSGALGAFWKKNAEKEIEKMQARADNGEIRTDSQGAAFWARSGKALPSDSAEILGFTTFEFDSTATADLREAQTIAFLAGYRHTPTAEERAEMQAVFGKGTTVVDCLSGQKIRL